MKTFQNLLPYDGISEYYGKIMDSSEADHHLDVLMNTIEWKNDEARIFGKHFITKRKVAWYGDGDFAYSYSNATRYALPWTPELLHLKLAAEAFSGNTFNSCLLNLYHDGDEAMGWHSDDEKALGKDTAIASVSFGAERRFLLRHRQTKETIEVLLEHGSLLVMKGTTQTHWIHSLPKMARIKKPRINLTFRSYIRQS